ncbi:MAG TPA: T9SS type A sorting domain-containing protein [Puia sp.]|nr:T9SS type A sorting domain-containing protein [Puia sp.]
MRKTFTCFLRGLVLVCGFLAFAGQSGAQTLTPRYIATCNNNPGFFEWLPQGYQPSGKQKWPLLIFLNGSGDFGNGDSTQLRYVLKNGPGRLMNQGAWPDSFTVKGKTFRFIVFMPEWRNVPALGDLDTMVDYAITHYNVDLGRVYLVGLSSGGNAVWWYSSASLDRARRLAAIVPMSAGYFWAGSYGASVYQQSNMAIFAAANRYDSTIVDTNTIQAIGLINAYKPAMTYKALDTIWDAWGHDAWTETCDPNMNLHNGMNVYQWMLQYSRDSGDITPPPDTTKPTPPDTTKPVPPDTTQPNPPDTTKPTPPDTTQPNPPDTTQPPVTPPDTTKPPTTTPPPVTPPDTTTPPPPPTTPPPVTPPDTTTPPTPPPPPVTPPDTSKPTTPPPPVTPPDTTKPPTTPPPPVTPPDTTKPPTTPPPPVTPPDTTTPPVTPPPPVGPPSTPPTTPPPSTAPPTVPAVPPPSAPPPSTPAVQLSTFSAVLLSWQPKVGLSWATMSEANNRYFVVQRSRDGNEFINIDTVSAAPEAIHGHYYSAIDETPGLGDNYYRLLQVGMDNDSTYPEIRKVIVPAAYPQDFSISPNPASGQLHLYLTTPVTGDVKVRLLDVSGRALAVFVYQKQDELWMQTIDVGNLSPGSYFIQVIDKNNQVIRPFIKR